MTFNTKINLNSNKIEQCSDEVLNLSGCTQIYTGGQFIFNSGATLSISANAGTGKVWTSDASGIGTWQISSGSGGTGTGTITGGANGLSTSGANIILGGALTGNTIIQMPSNNNLIISGSTDSCFNVMIGGVLNDHSNPTACIVASCEYAGIFAGDFHTCCCSSYIYGDMGGGYTNIGYQDNVQITNSDLCLGTNSLSLSMSDSGGSSQMIIQPTCVEISNSYGARLTIDGANDSWEMGTSGGTCVCAYGATDTIGFNTQNGPIFELDGLNDCIYLNTQCGTIFGINGLNDEICLQSAHDAGISIMGTTSEIQINANGGSISMVTANANMFLNNNLMCASIGVPGSALSFSGTSACFSSNVIITGYLAISGMTTCNTANTALVWNSGTSRVHGYPIIDEWVGSEAELLYAGQKFAYPTQTIMQTDIGTCITIPNYIQICNINLKNVGDTPIFTIPAGKTALLNCATLIILNDASPTCFSVSIGNNYCAVANCSNNNIAGCQISDVLTNEVYDLIVSSSSGIPESSGSILYFRVGSGSTSACNLCAHLLVEGFIY